METIVIWVEGCVAIGYGFCRATPGKKALNTAVEPDTRTTTQAPPHTQTHTDTHRHAHTRTYARTTSRGNETRG